MIVQCENCQAKFRLDDSKIPEQGRKVRCSKCSHVFFVQRQPEPSEASPPQPPQETWEAPTGEASTSGQAEPTIPEPEPMFEPTVRIDLAAQEGPPMAEQDEAPIPPPPRARARRNLTRPLLLTAGAVAALAIVVLVLARLGLLPFQVEQAQESPTAHLVIDQAQLQGKWEKNAQVPRIFIINGTVMNQSKKPRSFVKVRGLLLDKSGKTVKEVWAFCGNSIPLEDLRTKAPSEIQGIMRNRQGEKGANKLLPPGARIPFTLVFFEVPEGVETFGAEVVEAQIPTG
jgi:predicted Zn finger-like uncharacterized protein